MKALTFIRISLAIILDIFIFLLIVILVLLSSTRQLINRDNLSNYIKTSEILNMDLGIILNKEEEGKTIKESIYELGVESNIPKEILNDIFKSEEINHIFGDFFNHTINYLFNEMGKPQLSKDSIDKLKEVANRSLDDNINLMLENEQLDSYIDEFSSKIVNIIPDRQEIVGDLPIDFIQKLLNFNRLYIYIIIAVLLFIITLLLWSLYKPLKYLAIPMIISGVMFAILGSLNNLFCSYVSSHIQNLTQLILPLITIFLTIIFKIGVLISFCGIFLMIIYVVINRIVINNYEFK